MAEIVSMVLAVLVYIEIIVEIIQYLDQQVHRIMFWSFCGFFVFL